MTERFSTTDFYTAAVLIAQEFKLIDLTIEEGKRVKTFHFEKTDELKDILLSYRNGELVGNIREFKNAIENVKDLLHCS